MAKVRKAAALRPGPRIGTVEVATRLVLKRLAYRHVELAESRRPCHLHAEPAWSRTVTGPWYRRCVAHDLGWSDLDRRGGMQELKLFVTERFARKYDGAIGLRHFAEVSAHEFARRAAANPALWWRDYNNVRGVSRFVLEDDLSGRCRLLAYPTKGELTLLDMGDKDIVPRYSDQKLRHDLETRSPAPPQFELGFSSSLFRTVDGPVHAHYHGENTREWVLFLDEDQERAANKLVDLAYDAVAEGRQPAVGFLLGGPGTGKTAVLANVLLRLAPMPDELRVGVAISDELAKYLEAAIPGLDLESFRVSPHATGVHNIVLFDDPSSFDELRLTLANAQNGWCSAVIAGFDPLQLADALTDKDYEAIKREYAATEFPLRRCYRQKRNVGTTTKRTIDIIAESTPFLDTTKIKDHHSAHRKLTALANELEFVNPGGREKLYEDATSVDVEREVVRLVSSRTLWKHWEPLLVVLDTGMELVDEATAALNGIRHHVVAIEDVERVKGLEYQHVFMFLHDTTYKELQAGFGGTGRSVYNRRRQLRIPFSRGKDSLVTFACPYTEAAGYPLVAQPPTSTATMRKGTGRQRSAPIGDELEPVEVRLDSSGKLYVKTVGKLRRLTGHESRARTTRYWESHVHRAGYRLVIRR